MNKYHVKFICPDNSTHTLNYYEVEEFCKNLCLNDDNKEKFEEFKKDYGYFSPYFDFVMFELDYILINPLFSGGQGLFHIDDALYEAPINSFDYERCFNFAKEIYNFIIPIPFMTKVSETELDIKKTSSKDTGDVMIDPNLYGMMSKSGTLDGSHVVTSASILNQLMIKSKAICEYFFEYLYEGEMDVCNDPINFIVTHLGFMRATAADIDPMLIGNMPILGKEQVQFIYDCDDNDYKFYDVEDTEAKSYIKEYREIIKKD